MDCSPQGSLTGLGQQATSNVSKVALLEVWVHLCYPLLHFISFQDNSREQNCTLHSIHLQCPGFDRVICGHVSIGIAGFYRELCTLTHLSGFGSGKTRTKLLLKGLFCSLFSLPLCFHSQLCAGAKQMITDAETLQVSLHNRVITNKLLSKKVSM